MRRSIGLVCAAMLLGTSGVAVAAPSEDNRGQQQKADQLDVYTVEMDAAESEDLRAQGYDVVDTRPGERRGQQATVEVDVIASGQEIALLRGKGHKVGLKRNAAGLSTAEAATLEAENGFNVWRNWSEPGGIEDEVRMLADQFDDLVELQVIGESLQGEEILALRVTADVQRTKEGKRPQVLYSSLQHAREWITVETNRRLLRHYLEGYGSDERVTDILDTTELWFVIVANPDGYDWTFTEGQRLWRKNLRDNNGDGEITTADGVDLNRNFPTNWGYDNEGSSPNPASNIYRGEAPSSEPETQALDGLMADQDFVFQLNWHSAAELLLYGIGWQVATPSPDDLLHIAVNGTDDNPAVPGYDPDISAELYTTNGDTTDHAAEAYGIMSYTPELDTCESAEDIFPDDDFGDDYCESEGRSGFEFPDDEALIQAVFEKNLPYALSVAESADDPTNPETDGTTGLEAPNFEVDTFEVSYGSPQTVAVVTKREFKNLTMRYSINGGQVRSLKPTEWQGGERYGGTNNTHYAEYRGTITDAEPGDSVEVWFDAREVSLGRGNSVPPALVESERFTYQQASDSDAPVLILANEDYQGFTPVQNLDAPAYVDVYGAALEANGIAYDVWDVTAQGVPHDLGVLSHYEAIVWELGDNRITQEEDDVLTQYFNFGSFPRLSVSEDQQYLTMNVRDYLNEGGKLFESGEWIGEFGQLAANLGGIFYALNGDEEAPCVVTTSIFDDCLILSDDFQQYYQGVYSHNRIGEPEGIIGTGTPLEGVEADIDGAEVPGSTEMVVTSNVLPEDEFPQFASSGAARYAGLDLTPYEPFSGEGYAAALHADASWMRLARTVDLTGASSGDLSFQLSYDTEQGGWDNIIVEVRPVGTDDWDTIPETGGLTQTAPPAECEQDYYIDMHPELLRYLTRGNPCGTTGTSGDWNSTFGNSGGWIPVSYDLSAYAGEEIEVVISYVTDPAFGGVGVFVDDAVVTVDGVADTTDFESGAGPWTVPGAPAGSPGNFLDWQIGGAAYEPPSAAISTEDTVTFGFGFEAISTAEERALVMGEIMDYLMGTP